ncbi:hypothetical protein HZA26_01965 [Candidatus Nomurabacteria bacterium]|nr:hypothetical protein [Candidatus Nomurabacteria bacterium]
MGKAKKIDLIILLIYPIFGAIISHLLNINAFGSVIVFFGIPSLYLTFKEKRHIKRAALFSLLAVPIMIIVDYIAHLNDQWIIPNSVLPRIFEYVTIEVILWAVFHFYFVIMFYEHFLHHHFTKNLWSQKIRYLITLCIFSFSIFLTLYSFFPASLQIEYFYLWVGIILILIPIILQLFSHPKFISKFFETAAYFFYLTLTYEITALQLGWWDFPGKQFIGWIYISNIKFPLEELIFWLMLTAMAILTYYEYFEEEEK